MRKQLLLLGAVGITALSNAQDPHLTTWMFNTTGYASYNVGAGTVNMTDSADVLSMCYNVNNVFIRSEGLASYEMGPFVGNPNVPAAQGFVWKIKRSPQPETGAHTAEPVTGPLGVAVNGIALYGKGDSRSYDPMSGQNTPMGLGIWNADAWVSEGSTMDANGNGHPQQTGQYHYHANPKALYNDPSATHSPIIGWAFDGYPIYGPFGYSDPNDNSSPIKRMQCGYELRNITTRDTLPDGSVSTPPGPNVNATFPIGTYWEDYKYTGIGDLDEYNGRTCVTPEYPGGTYAYFLSTDVSGDPAFPYMIGMEYYGVVSTSDIQNGYSATIPAGVTCTGPGTAINETGQIEFKLYPNPAGEYVNIEVDGPGTIEVLDMQGRLVLSAYLDGNDQITTGSLSSGLYTIRLTDTEGRIGSGRILISN